MDHYEMVEKLRQKANVSYEEAKAALEAADWDVLDALVLLENEGKVKQDGPTFTTEEKPQPKEKKKSEFSKAMKTLADYTKKFTNFMCRNNLYISWRDEEKIDLPLVVPFILLCVMFPLMVILLIVGFFCGARYSFKGPDMKKVQCVISGEKQENGPSSQN